MNSAKYTCHECDRECDGVAIGATGWFSYPPGWFLKDDDVVCSEACAAAFDGRDVKLVDEKVAGVGGAAVAGFIAGMAIQSIGNLLCEVATKVPCVRCGRPLIDGARRRPPTSSQERAATTTRSRSGPRSRSCRDPRSSRRSSRRCSSRAAATVAGCCPPASKPTIRPRRSRSLALVAARSGVANVSPVDRRELRRVQERV